MKDINFTLYLNVIILILCWVGITYCLGWKITLLVISILTFLGVVSFYIIYGREEP